MKGRMSGKQKIACVCVLAIAVLTIASGLRNVCTEDVDSASYRLMAEGRMSEVVAPYTKRVLNPFFIRAVASAYTYGYRFLYGSRERGNEENLQERTSASTREQAAVAVSVFWLFLALVFFVELLSTRLSCLQILVLGVNPVFALSVFHTWLPDLPALALLLATLLALDKKRTGIALACLFGAILARDAILLFAALWMILACIGKRKREAFGVLLTSLAACVTVAWLSKEGQGNIHGVGGVTYMLMKVAANGLVNFAGVVVWSNIYSETLSHFYPGAPIWKIALPPFLQFGNIREIGIYSFHPQKCLSTFIVLIFLFGCLVPISVKRGVSFLRKDRAIQLWHDVRNNRLFFPVLCALTGTFFLLLTPFVGRTIIRYAGYAWPLFWLCAAPEAERSGVFRKTWFRVCQLTLPWLALAAVTM